MTTVQASCRVAIVLTILVGVWISHSSAQRPGQGFPPNQGYPEQGGYPGGGGRPRPGGRQGFGGVQGGRPGFGGGQGYPQSGGGYPQRPYGPQLPRDPNCNVCQGDPSTNYNRVWCCKKQNKCCGFDSNKDIETHFANAF